VTLLPGVPLQDEHELERGSVEGATEAMYKAIMAEPANTIWLVAIGPLTNIAHLVRAHPDVVAHLRGLSIMGGAIGNNHSVSDGKTRKRWLGKDGDTGEEQVIVPYPTRFAEFNIYSDAQAAAEVFAHDELAGKTTLISLDLTHHILATEEIFQLLFHGAESEKSLVSRIFEEILNHNRKAYQSYYDHLPGSPLHDALAVAIVLEDVISEPRFVDNGRRSKISVRTTGDEAGRTTIEENIESGGHGKGVRIPIDVDKAVFWMIMAAALEEADRTYL
jgi:uridine nucleosidase